MTSLDNMRQKSADWRAQLRVNEKRTKYVILMFILIYLCLGLLVDVYLATSKLYVIHGQAGYLPTSVALRGLLTFQIFPYATVTMVGVAIISLWVTYTMHDKLMLLGTEYRELTPDTARTVEEKRVYNVVEEMKVAAGLRYMPKVYLIEANYMNAFASGYSEKSAMVAITQGLLYKLDRSELQAVMAHELSHIRHHDIKLTLTASMLSNLMLIVIDIFFYSVIFSRDRDRNNGLLFIVILLRYLLPLITVMLMLYLSRTREFMADAGCVELTRDNEPLARALMKIHNDHRANQEKYNQEYGTTAHEEVRQASYLYDPRAAGLTITQSVSNMFSTHPPLEARLKALGFEQRGD